MKTPRGWLLWLLLVLFCSGGASCRQWGRQSAPLSPVAFAGPPTLDDILYTVNANSHRVSRLSTESATLGTPFGGPALRATLALERPRRLRLRGKLIGQELDLGSNDQLFWLWARSDPERALYYAYHEQFVQQASNHVLPVGPDWLIESLGLVTLEPSGWYEGPAPRPDGTLEIRARLERGGAQFTRVLVIDPKYGWIAEQQLLDAAGQLLAVSRCANHVFYPEAGVTLPHRVHMELPPAQLSFHLEVSRYSINQLPGDPGQLFSIPHYDGYRLVNLSDPAALAPQPAYPSPGAPGPGNAALRPHTAYRLKYRGFSGPR